MSGGSEVSAPRSLAAGKSLGVAALAPPKVSETRYVLQMEDRELQSTPTEKYKEVDVPTLCLRVTLPMMTAPARCPGMKWI